jgi:hypothetical protein
MKQTYLVMIKADDNKVLVKDDNYCTSVLLKENESPDDWNEISYEEYEKIIEFQKKQASKE